MTAITTVPGFGLHRRGPTTRRRALDALPPPRRRRVSPRHLPAPPPRRGGRWRRRLVVVTGAGGRRARGLVPRCPRAPPDRLRRVRPPSARGPPGRPDAAWPRRGIASSCGRATRCGRSPRASPPVPTRARSSTSCAPHATAPPLVPGETVRWPERRLIADGRQAPARGWPDGDPPWIARSTPDGRYRGAMRCPFCAADDDKVVDSRPADDGAAVRRRRECLGVRAPLHHLRAASRSCRSWW